MRAILIDAVNQKIVEVNAKGLEDYYRLLNVELIEVAVTLPNDDVIYVDEEGLLKEVTCGFSFRGPMLARIFSVNTSFGMAMMNTALSWNVRED